MPLLDFTEGDRLSSLIVPTAWYTLELTEIDGPKAAKSQNSMNIFLKAQVVKGQYQGKVFDILVNNAFKNMTILGSQQFFPFAWLNFDLAAAINKIAKDAVPLRLDTDTLLRKPFDAKIEKAIYEGVPTNTFLMVLPEGKGVDEKAPF